MAAPMLSKSQASTTIRGKSEKKKRKHKNIACSGLDFTWPKTESSTEEVILEKMKSTISPLGIAKVIRSKKEAEKPIESNENTSISISEEKKEAREQLVIGVNAVTKGLERDMFRLVLTCSSTQPPLLTQHLIGLAASRTCPILQISRLNETLSALMNFKSAVAVGFKKCSEKSIFDELVNFILQYAEIPKLPWIDYNLTCKEDELCVEDSKLREKMSEVKKGKNQKDEDEDSSEVENTGDVCMKGNETESDVEEESAKVQNITSVPQRKTDYSQFYVYKADTKGVENLEREVMSFKTRKKDENETLESQETDVLRLGDKQMEPTSSSELENNKVRKRKQMDSSSKIKFSDFQSLHVMQVYGNENREKKIQNVSLKPKKKKIKK